MPAFTFLGDEFVLVAAPSRDRLGSIRPALLLYGLDQRPGRVENSGSYLLCFLFQTPRSGLMDSSMNLTSDPSPAWSSSSSLQVPFQVPCDERIIAFNLHRKTFLIPAKALLGHVGDHAVEREGRDIEWEEWGSSCIDTIRNHPPWDTWTCFVFGMRHVLPSTKFRDDKRVMIVRDLCPRRYMKASEEERSESEALYQAMGYKGGHSHSIVKCVPLPTSIGESPGVRLMISEDSIIILEVRHMRVCVFMAARLMLLECRIPLGSERN
jgi:hypothetical protein